VVGSSLTGVDIINNLGADAGLDGHSADVSPVDSGPVDSGPVDTGPPDTGPPDTGPPDTGPPDTGPAAKGATIDWGTCGKTLPDGVPHQHCGMMLVPLDWAAPDGKKIDIRVSRLPGWHPDKQLWLLAGGPGQPGLAFYKWAKYFQPWLGSWNLYMPDHRGVGASNPLVCPAQHAPKSDAGHTITGAELPACATALTATYAGTLQHYTTSNAARDVHAGIQAVSKPGQTVAVFGASYGSYWLHRFMQLFPTGADLFAMESVCAGPQCNFDSYQGNFNLTAKQYFELCAQDPLCSAKVGKAPWQRLAKLHAKIASGHCKPISQPGKGKYALTTTRLKSWLGSYMRSGYYRPVALAMMHRYDRCSPADVKVLSDFIDSVLNPSKPAPKSTSSQEINVHIGLSEMRTIPPLPIATHEKVINEALVLASPKPFYEHVHTTWPTYPKPALADKWAVFNRPLLMMNGTLDPQTPWTYALAAEAQLKGQAVTLVEFPHIHHGATSYVDIFSPPSGGGTCGVKILADFLDSPGSVGTACTKKLKALRFDLPKDVAKQLFGVPSLYDNPKTDDPAPATGTPPLWDEVVRDIRRGGQPMFVTPRTP